MLLEGGGSEGVEVCWMWIGEYHPRLVRLLRWLHFAFARPQSQLRGPHVVCRAATRLVDFLFTSSALNHAPTDDVSHKASRPSLTTQQITFLAASVSKSQKQLQASLKNTNTNHKMCRPSQFGKHPLCITYQSSGLRSSPVYSCNHTMGQGTHYCIHRECIGNTADTSLLTAEKEIKLIDSCHRDARMGTENKNQGHPCGRMHL